MRQSFSIVLCLVSLCGTAWAQFDSGQISGFVRDATGAVIPGADISATNEGTGQVHRTTTNSNGYYVFPTLVVGAYTISAEVSVSIPGYEVV